MKKILSLTIILFCIFLTACGISDPLNQSDNLDLSIGETSDLRNLSLTLLNVEPSSETGHIQAQFASSQIPMLFLNLKILQEELLMEIK